jgi:thioredoxin-like negative regulator of GroEL
MRLDRADEAVPHLQEARRLAPNDADHFRWLGNAFRRCGRMDQAVEALARATQLKADGPEVFSDLGGALCELGSPEQAVDALHRALELRPDYPDARWNLACAQLSLGDFERGFANYESRTRAGGRSPRPLPGAPWNGDTSDLAGKTLLLVCEQGLGDTFQFIRFASTLARHGARIVVECQPALRAILESVEGVAEVVPRGRPLPAVQLNARLMSIPHLLKTSVQTIPNHVPYLGTSEERIRAWRDRVPPVKSPTMTRVGIAWQGSTSYPSDRLRSIPLSAFAPLARIASVQLISLQMGPGHEQIAGLRQQVPVFELSPALDDAAGPRGEAFLDTAALMHSLDLIITSDTAVAHLAGAMGRKVWVVLPFASDWRWLRGREDSPWYPTMRLFRQSRPGDWTSVFEEVATALCGVALSRSPATNIPANGIPVLLAPGELIDRITILQLKAERISDPAARSHVLRELKQMVAARESSLPPQWKQQELDALENELSEVNATLWDVEDLIRVCERANDFGPRFVELARSVYQQNDRRAAIKRAISAMLGSQIIDPKSYCQT